MVSEHGRRSDESGSTDAPVDAVSIPPLRRSRSLSPVPDKRKFLGIRKLQLKQQQQQQQQQQGGGGSEKNDETRRVGLGGLGGLGFLTQLSASKDDTFLEHNKRKTDEGRLWLGKGLLSQFGASKDDTYLDHKPIRAEKTIPNPLTALRRVAIERRKNKEQTHTTHPETNGAPSSAGDRGITTQDPTTTTAAAVATDHAELSGLSSSFVVAGPSAAATRRDRAASHVTQKTVMVGPVVDFLTADATLFMFVTILVAVYPTMINWQIIVEQRQVPLECVASWLLVSFAVGHVVNMEIDWSIISASFSALVPKPRQAMTPTVIEIRRRELLLQEKIMQQQKRNTHSCFLGAIQGQGSKIKFKSVAVPKSWEDTVIKAWTVLNPSNHRPPLNLWETTVDPTLDRTKNCILIQRLLNNTMFKRIKKSELLVNNSNHETFPGPGDADEEEEEKALDTQMGRFELLDADTLDEFMIVPMMKLRGMDIFMTDDPETEVSTHPWLIEQGLRDCPTLVINVITPWANLVLYFEMPFWVKRLSNLEILEDDSDDVRALKSFLNGDDEYRHPRLKIIPSVVEGPLAVKVLAPPKREIAVSCSSLPVSYHKFEAEVKNGRKLAPAFEIELDCVSNRAMRVTASILKRNLESLAIDAAVVIQKPDGHKDDEPECCLGLWRFNKIDVSTCPTIPDRFESEAWQTKESSSFLADPSVRRASFLMGMSAEDVQKLAMEL